MLADEEANNQHLIIRIPHENVFPSDAKMHMTVFALSSDYISVEIYKKFDIF